MSRNVTYLCCVDEREINHLNVNQLVMNTDIKQTNYYAVYDSMGRKTEIIICASNIKEAGKIAKTDLRVKALNSNYWSLKRAYSGGVRG